MIKRIIACLHVLLGDNYIVSIKENAEWIYFSNCDPVDTLDQALDLEEKCLTRLDNIPEENYQAEINVQDAFLIANDTKLDR